MNKPAVKLGEWSALQTEDEHLDELIAQTLRAPDIDALLFANQGFFPRFMEVLSRTLERAFEGADPAARLQAHRALFFLYEENFEQVGEGLGNHQFHPFVVRVRNDIERAWERFERNRVDIRFEQVPADGEGFSRFFRGYCAGHRLTGHPLFDFIEREATREQIVRFFTYDSTLVLRFCDLITLSMVGADDRVRGILAEHFWDEMGNGDLSRRHTYLFKRLLRYVGAEQLLGADRLAVGSSWQALAGYNLYMYLSLHRRNYFMSLGCLGSGELMDSDQYVKIVRGCERVGFTDREELAYYVEHSEADIRHGNEWLEEVLVPLVERYGAARRDILTGASLRLNTTADYYNFLLRDLKAR